MSGPDSPFLRTRIDAALRVTAAEGNDLGAVGLYRCKNSVCEGRGNDSRRCGDKLLPPSLPPPKRTGTITVQFIRGLPRLSREGRQVRDGPVGYHIHEWELLSGSFI